MTVWTPSYSDRTHRYYKARGDRPVTTFSYAAQDAWSAAAAATRINEGYQKLPKFEYDEDQEQLVQIAQANKVIVRKMLEAGQGWTDEDVQRGAEACAYWQGGLIKIMAGTANSFESSAISIAGKETIESAYDLAVLSSLIASAERGVKRDEVNHAKSLSNSVHVGSIKGTLSLKHAEVIATHYVQAYNKFRIEVKCDSNLYTWWSSNDHKTNDLINVKGKVKAHLTERSTGAKVTQLNYVKVI